jgi:hypothetical protein
MSSDEEELDRQVAAMRAAITPEQRKMEQFERECRRAFVQACTDLDKKIGAATGDRMRVFNTVGHDWEARSHVFPASTGIGEAAWFTFSVEKPGESGHRFSSSFSVTPSNQEHIGIQNAARAEAFAVAERIAMQIISDMERDDVSLRRWTDIRNDALQKGQAAVEAEEGRRRRFHLLAWAGIGILAVAATLFALAQIAAP